MARSNFETGDLAARLLALEEDAFKEFGRLFGTRFRTYFLRRGLSPSDAEDLAVSCVTDIVLRVEKYTAQEAIAFEAWVFTLARNYCNDWWRKHRSTEPLSENLEAAAEEEEEAAIETGGTLAVREALKQVSDADQLVIELRHFDPQHSYIEIAERLGITPGAARVRHSRALERLETILAKDPRVARILERDTRSGLERNT